MLHLFNTKSLQDFFVCYSLSAAKCETNINSRDNYYDMNDCSQVREVPADYFTLNSRASPPKLTFNFYSSRSLSDSFIHTVTILGDSIRNRVGIPSIATVDLVIRRGLIPQRRRKRDIDPIFYARHYDHVFLKPDLGNVTFKLDPPVYSGNIDSDAFDLDIVFIEGNQIQNFKGSIQTVVHYIPCPPTNVAVLPPPDEPIPDGPQRKKRQSLNEPPIGNVICSTLYRNLTILELEARRNDCGLDDERYEVLQLCLDEAIEGNYYL